MSEQNNLEYWKQIARDAVDARDRMQERQRQTVAECERLRVERDKACENMGRYREQLTHTVPDAADLINRAINGEITLTVTIKIEKDGGERNG